MAEDILDLVGKLLVRTPDGAVYTLRPGRQGRGVALALEHPAEGPARTAAPGRYRQPETADLARRMETDANEGTLRPASEYAKAYVEAAGVKPTSALHTVYRLRAQVLASHPGVKVARPAGGGRPGRPLKPETEELRRRMEKDAQEGALRPTADYAEWYVKKAGVRPRSAEQTVYRERRRVLEAHPEAEQTRRKRRRRKGAAAKSKGTGAVREASLALEPLRKRLEKDIRKDGLADAKQYVQFVLDTDKKIGLKQARSMVYREHRAARKRHG